MNFINKVIAFLSERKYLYGVLAGIFIVGGIFIFKNGKINEKTILVSRSDFVSQVSVSGKVIAAEDVDLGFNNGGRIDSVLFSVGEEIIKAGTLIATVDAKDARKAVHDAEIDLESAKLALEKFKLENSDKNLNSDLAKAYDDGFTEVSSAFVDLSTVVDGLDEILHEENISDSAARSSGEVALNYRDEAEKLYYKALNAFKDTRNNFRLLSRDSSEADIEAIVQETYETTRVFVDAVKSVKNLVDYLANDSNSPSDFTSSQDTLSGYTDTTNEHLADLLSISSDINDNKEAFLDTDLDIRDLELTIKQEENALKEARNELEDYYIRAPFEGIITEINAKIGEIASPNTPLVTMMSVDTFQIESYVPEVNIAQIKLGDKADVALDAYGESVLFSAKVISIDPAETIRDGVSTYKIKLQFLEKDNRIKSGMTANVSVISLSKPNTIVVPGGVVFDKDGKKFVQIKAENKISDREIIIGSVSSLGQVEIISGLSEGEMIILNPTIK